MKTNNMYFIRNKKVKIPERSGLNAGIDFFIPKNFKNYILKPGTQIKIASGIHVRIPKNHCLIAFNKSGIAVKHGLQVGACVIDENYTGEIHLNLFNVGNKDVLLKANQKIVQFILLKPNYIDLKECDSKEKLYKNFNITERGENGFGSTNK